MTARTTTARRGWSGQTLEFGQPERQVDVLHRLDRRPLEQVVLGDHDDRVSPVGARLETADDEPRMPCPIPKLGDLVADLDRPREGFLQVSQQAMQDLQTSMRADASDSR